MKFRVHLILHIKYTGNTGITDFFYWNHFFVTVVVLSTENFYLISRGSAVPVQKAFATYLKITASQFGLAILESPMFVFF